MCEVDHLTNTSHQAVSAFCLFQVEDTMQEGQEKEEQQDKEKIKAEDNAIEMSEDFDGQMHDGDENEPGNLNCLQPIGVMLPVALTPQYNDAGH